MNNRLFNRQLYAIISDTSGAGLRFDARNKDNPKGFDIEFSVSKTQEKEPNDSTVTIYDMDEESRRRLDDGLLDISLYGGYENDTKLISLGEITEISHIYENASTKTIISYQDSLKSYVDPLILQTFPTGTPIVKIIKSIAGVMGYKDPFIADIDETLAIPTAHTLNKVASSCLKNYCDKAEVKFSMQNGKLIIKKEDSYTGSKQAILISEDSGLVGPVEKRIRKAFRQYNKVRKALKKPTAKSIIRRSQTIAEAKAKFYKKQDDKDHEVKFKTLLMPENVPGTYLKFNTKFLTNVLAVTYSVTHSGSNFDDEFYTEVIAKIA